MPPIQRPWTPAPHFDPTKGTLGAQVAAQRALVLEGPPQRHDPFALKGMDEAVDLLLRHINRHSRILIHGDYDVDGLTATAILYHYLSSFGLSLETHIPNRLVEGYGLAEEGVAHAMAAGVSLVITVDCGVGSHEAIQALHAAGIEVLVSDHHQCPDVLPEAEALLDPSRPDETYPFPKLCGAGVAFKLVEALSLRLGEAPGRLDGLRDLVALGTMADLMPLLDENRQLVQAGLETLRQCPRPGFQALFELAHTPPDAICQAEIFSFFLAPRLNAAGRMGQVEIALRLLLTEEAQEARHLAQQLEQLNQERRRLEQDGLTLVHQQVLDDDLLRLSPILVVADAHLHAGVLGILATRLVDAFQRPALVLGPEGGEAGGGYTGSARSYGGLDLLETLQGYRAYFTRLGGHRQAAGLAVDSLERVHELCEQLVLDGLAPDCCIWQGLAPRPCDLVLDASVCTAEAYQSLAPLAPFGKGNEAPVFALENVEVLSVQTIGKTKAHLSLTLALPGGPDLKAVAFYASEQLLWLRPGLHIDLLGELMVDHFRGLETLKWKVHDLRLHAPGPRATALPEALTQDDAALLQFFVACYRLIDRSLSEGAILLDPEWFSQALYPLLGVWPTASLTSVILQVLMESAILKGERWPTGDRTLWRLSPHAPTERRRLSEAPSFQMLRSIPAQGGPHER